MPDSLDTAVKQLRKLFAKQFELQDELDRLTEVTTAAEADEKTDAYVRELRLKKREIWDYLENELLRYPPHHYARHAAQLKAFHDVAPYERSVFIMTKFPQGADPKDQALRDLIEAVKSAISAAGMAPRIAQFGYHDWLWDNVELYLVGCARGVAIVEDRYLKELNPNVALEWGWMKGMGKRVFFLMEEQFAHQRADWGGLLSKTFTWDAPAAGVHAAILEWLRGREEV